ncbi:MAG: response regulator [Acidobacteria bacterium]|nr:response regulator [Acidobacteriota bacterium]
MEARERSPSGTVLVVDDEPDVLYLLRLTFESAGYRVQEAAHGAAALECVMNGPLPLVVVADLMMPVMDGRELISRLRSDPRTARLPILLLSANPNGTVGADAMVRKPFKTSDLIETVRSLIEGGG